MQLKIAEAEKELVHEENLVAATAKDFFGDSSKAVASTFHPPTPAHEKAAHTHSAHHSSHTLSQPAPRSFQ